MTINVIPEGDENVYQIVVHQDQYGDIDFNRFVIDLTMIPAELCAEFMGHMREYAAEIVEPHEVDGFLDWVTEFEQLLAAQRSNTTAITNFWEAQRADAMKDFD
jgi:hypothetical protein